MGPEDVFMLGLDIAIGVLWENSRHFRKYRRISIDKTTSPSLKQFCCLDFESARTVRLKVILLRHMSKTVCHI